MISLWLMEESKDEVKEDQFSVGSLSLNPFIFIKNSSAMLLNLPDVPKSRIFPFYWGLWAVGEEQFSTPWCGIEKWKGSRSWNIP